MGVSFSGLIHGTAIHFDDLRGRTIAIDGYNVLYQFLSTIRDRFTGEPLRDSHGRITSHLSGLFYRTSKLMENGISPVIVFDGEPPAFKRATIAQRVKIREAARVKWQAAVKDGDTEKIRTYSQGATRLTRDMVDEAKSLLGFMGISWVQAPSEGEAQATHLLMQGRVWAVGSQDWDSLLFGAARMVKNLTISGKRKVPGRERYTDIGPELIELDKVLPSLGITQEQLILLGMVIGTDYNPGGVKGVGPKTALKLVREHKTLDALLSHISWESPEDPHAIMDFFLHPPVRDSDIVKQRLDEDKLLAFMTDHDFSEERTRSVLGRLEKTRSTRAQKGLTSFLK